MKKLFLILITMVLGCFTVNAQLDTAIYNKLSDAAKHEIMAAQQTKNIETQMQSYTKVASYGKEVGIAIREGLTAIKDVTVDLSKTDVGKTTMWLIVWKVAGRDMVRLGFGIFLALISLILVTRSYFRTFKRKICIESAGLFKAKKYELVDHRNCFWEYPNAAAAGHVCVLLVLWAASALIMFG